MRKRVPSKKLRDSRKKSFPSSISVFLSFCLDCRSEVHRITLHMIEVRSMKHNKDRGIKGPREPGT